LSQVISDGASALDLARRAAQAVNARELAQLTGRSAAQASEHFVQFYEGDAFLIESLADYIGDGLKQGDGCVVVATLAHRQDLEARLIADGLDVGAAVGAGQYLALDAAETLAGFMSGGSPQAGLFEQVVGSLVARAAEGRRGLRIFGEMVALLWAEGNRDGALRLEEFWNGLHGSSAAPPFSLFCAYPMGGDGSFDGVCASHSRSIPAESYTTLPDAEARLRTIVELQQQAASLRAVKEELEEMLRREQAARAEAEAANRLKDEFLATVSHELRTPLTAIVGWARMLSDGRLDGEATANALRAVERNARAQTQIVEDLLDVSRIIMGQLRLDVRTIDPAPYIDAAVESVRPAAEGKGVRLQKVIDTCAGPVSADPARLQQVFWNLLSNAVKFTPAGGRVRITLARADSHVVIEVSDDGAGIRPEFLPYVFDRFRQADMSSTRRHGGLGLGLSIVRNLVELHGGVISAESAGDGQGSTFTVKLPLAGSRESRACAERERPEPAAERRAACPDRLDGVRVLVVDDEPDTREMLRVMLGQCGAEVTEASSAREALELFERASPDVVVSDIGMPGEDGYELMRKVRALPAGGGERVPAVALTAYARTEDRLQALRAGYQMHVPKPVEMAELTAVIVSLVGRRRAG
jgi:signal transduction histidine kinase/ActR/RegA family two-component response regulator